MKTRKQNFVHGNISKSVIKKHLDNLDKEQVEKAYQKFRVNYSPARIEEIKKLKEEEYQDGFLRDLFVDVFGYILKPDDNYNLVREFKNQGDGKKADGAIVTRGNVLLGDKAVAVIELKSTKTKDLKNVTEQAFNYKNNQPECKYVITSNFQKLRFYIDYANEYEEFDLFNLQKYDFELLYLLLNANSIFSGLPLKLKEETKFHEQEVSDKLYKDYSVFKSKLFENLIKNNPENDKLTLFNKSQKLLDRFLFILFAEDSGLLPPNSISRIIDTYHKLTELDAYKPIYDIYKQYFGYMNIGRKGKTNADDIPAYNGGLFYNDELLDNLKIDDRILIDDLLKLSEYDFNTEVDVNILGHIFEHSLSEIEEITAEILASRGHVPLALSKRKKDGVFYTPKYITQYIVENTIGTLCNEKRKELEIEEIEFDGSYRNKKAKENAPSLSAKGKKLYKKLNDYKDWLLSLKIVDPACGSGAFLNQALNFLIEEHKNIDDIIDELTNTALRLFDTEKSILENNLYGVDINEESVEIAKLSLWLRTAQKGRKLSNLNDNIKCGNSLIDDPEVAGDKAFDWNVEFPQIFKKKEKIAWHITTATHNSRYSQRMFDNHVTLGEAIWIDEKDEILVTETIAGIVKEDNLNVIEYNICGDHMHILLVCEKEEVPKIMGKIKGVSGRKYNIENGVTVTTRGHVPLSGSETATDRATATVATGRSEELPVTGKKKYNSLWTQKFGDRKINGEKDLQNVINYIRTNRQKHKLPENKKLDKIIGEMCCSVEHAFQDEYNGGFDVVIGNPPYVPGKSLNEGFKKYFRSNFKFLIGKFDLYILFLVKILDIVKKGGNWGVIVPNTILVNENASLIRKKYIEDKVLDTIRLFRDDVFPDASVESVVLILSKNRKIVNLVDEHSNYYGDFELESFKTDKFYRIQVSISKEDLFIINKIDNKSSTLGELADICIGIQIGGAGNSKEFKDKYISRIPEAENYKKFLDGKDFEPYIINWKGNYVLYGDWLHRKRDEKYFLKDKILIRQIGTTPVATIDKEKFYVLNTIYSLILNQENNQYSIDLLFAFINSSLIKYYWDKMFSDNKALFPKI